MATPIEGTHLYLLAPSAPQRVVAADLAERFSWFGADVVIAAGDEVLAVGTGAAIGELAEGGAVDAVVDEDRLLVSVDPPDELLALADRVVHLPTGGEPLVCRHEPAPAGDDPTRSRLQRLLVPPEGEVRAVVAAPELVTVDYWTPERCADLVAVVVDAPWAPDPDDPVPGSEVPLAAVTPALLAALEADLDDRLVPALRTVWPTFGWCGVDDAFVIRTSTDLVAAPLPLHHDIAQISLSLVLSDQHEGGGLAFPRQGWDSANLPVGTLVAWPSLVTHPHRALPVTAGTRYGLTVWLRLPE